MACVGAFKLLEKSSQCLFKAWRPVDKPGDLLTWRTDKMFLCSIGSGAFFCNPKRRSWVFVMATKLSATLSPPTRRNAVLLSLQHPCRLKSRSKSSSDCCKPVFGIVLRGVKRCRMWLTPDKLGTLQARVAACSAVLPSAAAMWCPLRNFEQMCGAECIQPKTPGLLRVLRD